MAKILMRAIGMDGQIDLLADRIIIRREGLLNALKYGFNSQREIPLSAISEIMFRAAKGLSQGSIEFVRSGRSVDEKNKAAHSIVKFHNKRNPEFMALKEKAFELIEQYSRRPQ